MPLYQLSSAISAAVCRQSVFLLIRNPTRREDASRRASAFSVKNEKRFYLYLSDGVFARQAGQEAGTVIALY